MTNKKPVLWPNFGGAFSGMGKEGSKDAGKEQFYIEITEEMIKNFTESAQVGGSIVFTFNKVTSRGNKHYFGKLRPQYDKNSTTAAATATKQAAVVTSVLD